jgi:hypothetical protein
VGEQFDSYKITHPRVSVKIKMALLVARGIAGGIGNSSTRHAKNHIPVICRGSNSASKSQVIGVKHSNVTITECSVN